MDIKVLVPAAGYKCVTVSAGDVERVRFSLAVLYPLSPYYKIVRDLMLAGF